QGKGAAAAQKSACEQNGSQAGTGSHQGHESTPLEKINRLHLIVDARRITRFQKLTTVDDRFLVSQTNVQLVDRGLIADMEVPKIFRSAFKRSRHSARQGWHCWLSWICRCKNDCNSNSISRKEKKSKSFLSNGS